MGISSLSKLSSTFRHLAALGLTIVLQSYHLQVYPPLTTRTDESTNNQNGWFYTTYNIHAAHNPLPCNFQFTNGMYNVRSCKLQQIPWGSSPTPTPTPTPCPFPRYLERSVPTDYWEIMSNPHFIFWVEVPRFAVEFHAVFTSGRGCHTFSHGGDREEGFQVLTHAWVGGSLFKLHSTTQYNTIQHSSVHTHSLITKS